ncbi:MAG: hypothetical protein J0I12_16240 [Candidatus Eremiobacteraeota bacterium]|nr:hypothetical protein [Candidatus Eremiobacteraeota bacterium]
MKTFACWMLLAGALVAADAHPGYKVSADFSGSQVSEARPRVVTRAGQPAEISIGQKDKPELTLKVTPSDAGEAGFVNLDCTLQIQTAKGPERVQMQTRAQLGEPIQIDMGERWSAHLKVELAD